jgi:hypothetical protein
VWWRRILTALTGVLIWFLAQVFSAPVAQFGETAVHSTTVYLFGEDHPIELQPICDALHQGKVVPPHAETNAAYHYRCTDSHELITRQQIANVCATEWSGGHLVLRNPDSADG